MMSQTLQLRIYDKCTGICHKPTINRLDCSYTTFTNDSQPA